MYKDITELRAQLEAKKLANKEALSNLLEAKKIELEIIKMDSDYFQNQDLITRDINSLSAIEMLIEEKQAKHNKKLRRVFGLGEIPSQILTIASNIQYAKLEDREELLIASQLPVGLIDDLVSSMGNASWFNPRETRIEDEKPFDIQLLALSIERAYIAMGLVSTPNLSRITKSNFETRFKSSRLQAEEVLANTVKYLTDDEVINYEE